MRDESHEGISVSPRGFFSTQMDMLKRGQPSCWPELCALSLRAHEIPVTFLLQRISLPVRVHGE